MTKAGDPRTVPHKIRDAWWFLPTSEDVEGTVMAHYLTDINTATKNAENLANIGPRGDAIRKSLDGDGDGIDDRTGLKLLTPNQAI